MIDRAATIAAADRLGLFVVGVAPLTLKVMLVAAEASATTWARGWPGR